MNWFNAIGNWLWIVMVPLYVWHDRRTARKLSKALDEINRNYEETLRNIKGDEE